MDTTRLSRVLPYDEYLPEAGIYLNKDRSLGAVFEAIPLGFEPMTILQLGTLVQSSRSWFSLPSSCTLQLLYEDRPPTPRIIVSIRYYPTSASTNGGHGQLAREIRKFSQLMTRFQHTSRIPLKRLPAIDLLNELRRFLNPKTHLRYRYTPYDSAVSLSEQILYSEPGWEEFTLSREGTKTKILAIESTPKYLFPGGLAFSIRLPFPVRLALSFGFPTKSELKRMIHHPEVGLRTARPLNREAPEAEVAEERDMSVAISVVIEAEGTDELEARTQEAVRFFQSEFECGVDSEADSSLCLSTLPLNFDPTANRDTSRSLILSPSEAAKLTPVFLSPPEITDSLGTCIARGNELIRLRPSREKQRNHSVLVSDNDLDQKAIIVNCYEAAKRNGEDPIVFRILGSAADPTGVPELDQHRIVFDPNSRLPVDPFRGVYDVRKIEFLTEFLLRATQLASPAFEAQEEHRRALEAAIRKATSHKDEAPEVKIIDGRLLMEHPATTHCSVREIVRALSRLPAEPDEEFSFYTVESLLQRLSPFYGNGIFSKLFEGNPDEPTEEPRDVYAYDLSALGSRSVLMLLSIMAIGEELRSVMSLERNHGRSGYLLIENVAPPNGNNFSLHQIMVELLETAHSRDLWTISTMPKIEDYFELQAGWTLWNSAEHYYFLPVRPDTVEFLTKGGTFAAPALDAIRSLRTKIGEYFDAFYINKEGSKMRTFRYFEPSLGRVFQADSEGTRISS